jgi:4-hydroxy-tetrahydrodipicolinate synthase
MFQGSMPALITPMHPDGSLDEIALRQLVDFHIENQSDALVIVGTTGESATLDEQEHCKVIRIAVEQANGRLPIIAGTGANSTTEAIELSQCAKAAGAKASLSVTPYYNKPTQEGLYQHFKAIAEVVDLPIILYNVPGRTGCDLQPATVERLSKINNIIGLKDATGDLARVRDHRRRCGKDFLLFSGNDDTGLDFILLGGQGVISVTANVAPKAMHDMTTLALQGNRAAAEAIDNTLIGLHKHLFIEPNPIPIKWAVQRLGLIKAGIRLPLMPLNVAYHHTVEQAMRDAGVIE